MVEPLAVAVIVALLIVILICAALDVILSHRRVRADYQRRLRSIVEREGGDRMR